MLTHFCGTIRLDISKCDSHKLQNHLEYIRKVLEMPISNGCYEVQTDANAKINYFCPSPKFTATVGGDIKCFGNNQQDIENLIEWFNLILRILNKSELVLVDAVLNVGVENGLSFVTGLVPIGFNRVRYLKKISDVKDEFKECNVDVKDFRQILDICEPL